MAGTGRDADQRLVLGHHRYGRGAQPGSDHPGRPDRSGERRAPRPPTRKASMSIGAQFIPEFDEEMATTRRLLEIVPSDRGAWKPHPKSFSLGHLAQLISGMPGWITQMLTQT